MINRYPLIGTLSPRRADFDTFVAAADMRQMKVVSSARAGCDPQEDQRTWRGLSRVSSARVG
jgi:hypothetical protein